MEKWVDVKGYEGLYQVSNMGNVKSLARITERKKGEMFVRERLLSKILWEGYFRVTLTKNSIQTLWLVHRLVAIHFIPNPINKPFVNHKDGNRSNNLLENLEWSTPKENSNHAWNNGLCDNVKKVAKEFTAKRNSIEVMDIVTGAKFSFIKDAALSIGMNPDTLSSMLRGDVKGAK